MSCLLGLWRVLVLGSLCLLPNLGSIQFLATQQLPKLAWVFLDEKQKLKEAQGEHRVCLTTDTWTSVQNLNYICLTAHFIDSD